MVSWVCLVWWCGMMYGVVVLLCEVFLLCGVVG